MLLATELAPFVVREIPFNCRWLDADKHKKKKKKTCCIRGFLFRVFAHKQVPNMLNSWFLFIIWYKYVQVIWLNNNIINRNINTVYFFNEMVNLFSAKIGNCCCSLLVFIVVFITSALPWLKLDQKPERQVVWPGFRSVRSALFASLLQRFRQKPCRF